VRAPLAILIAIALLGLTLPGISRQPALSLTATTDTGMTLVCERVQPGTLVTLTFTHSMYGGDVSETYAAAPDGTLARRRIVTANAAAAEYYATDGRVDRTGTGYEVIAPPFTTRELVIRADARGDHRLTVGGETRSLAALLDAPTQVRIALAEGGCG
jgi:hypothetical protein